MALKRIDVDHQRWEEVCLQSDAATFFHTRTWIEIIKRGYPGLREVSRMYEIGGVTAILPLFATPELKGVLTACDSLPAGTYGGVIADGPLPQATIDEMFAGLLTSRISMIKVTGSPFGQPG